MQDWPNLFWEATLSPFESVSTLVSWLDDLLEAYTYLGELGSSSDKGVFQDEWRT